MLFDLIGGILLAGLGNGQKDAEAPQFTDGQLRIQRELRMDRALSTIFESHKKEIIQ